MARPQSLQRHLLPAPGSERGPRTTDDVRRFLAGARARRCLAWPAARSEGALSRPGGPRFDGLERRGEPKHGGEARAGGARAGRTPQERRGADAQAGACGAPVRRAEDLRGAFRPARRCTRASRPTREQRCCWEAAAGGLVGQGSWARPRCGHRGRGAQRSPVRAAPAACACSTKGPAELLPSRLDGPRAGGRPAAASFGRARWAPAAVSGWRAAQCAHVYAPASRWQGCGGAGAPHVLAGFLL